ERRDVVDDLHAGDSSTSIVPIGDVTLDDLDASHEILRKTRSVAHEYPHVVAGRQEVPGQVCPREPGRAGDEHLHRSATMVTGDPKRRSAPTAASTRSHRRVTAKLPTFLWNAIGSTN